MVKLSYVKLLVLSLLALNAVTLHGQRSGTFQVTATQAKNFGGKKVPLVSGRGTIAGNYEAMWQKGGVGGRYILHPDGGGSVEVPALSQLHYAAGSGTFVTCGAGLANCVEGHAEMVFYDAGGGELKKIGKYVDFPFTARIAENGRFYIAGLTGEVTARKMVFTRFDQSGNADWTFESDPETALRIFVSGDNKTVALVSMPMQGSPWLHIRYFDASGNLIAMDQEHPALSALEFLSTGNVVLCMGTSWEMRDIANQNALVAYGQLTGSTVGEFPVTENPADNWFSIVTVADPAFSSDYRVEAFEVQTGQRIAGTVLAGSPVRTPYRMGELQSDGSLLINSDVVRTRLTLTY